MTAATVTRVISVQAPQTERLACWLEQRKRLAASAMQTTVVSVEALSASTGHQLRQFSERTLTRLAIALPVLALLTAYLLSTHANLSVIVHLVPALVLGLIAQPLLCLLNNQSLSQDI